MLPRVTLYNEISLDGRIEGLQMDVGRFYRLSFRWHADAILVGSRTAQSFGPPEPLEVQANELPAPAKEPLYAGFEDLVYEPRPLIVIPDSRGQVCNWQAIHAQPWYRDPVALVSRATPPDYLAYLKRRRVATVMAGADHVDLRAALEELNARFGVRFILTDCGGGLNGALLRAGLVDEVTVILNPSLVGSLTAQTVYRSPDAPGEAISLRLLDVERFADGALWLQYAVVQPRIVSEEDIMSTSDLWLIAQEAWDELSAVYGPVMARAAAAEAGLAEGTYFGWMLAAPGFEPDPISAERLAGRAPYTARSLNEARLADGAGQGLLRPAGEGAYYLTEVGRTAARRIFEAAYHAMALLQPLSAAELGRLADLLRRLVEASVAAPEPPGKHCLSLSRRIVPGDGTPGLAWIDQYLSDLNAYRDDAHIASWQPCGIAGAAWEAFTCLWRGEARTLDDLCERLAFRGHARADYADALADLAARGWIALGADGCELTDVGREIRGAAEQKTDDFFFAPWACLDAGELEELQTLLAGLRDGLPEEEPK